MNAQNESKTAELMATIALLHQQLSKKDAEIKRLHDLYSEERGLRYDTQKAIRSEVEGYCDGAPDADPIAKLGNRIMQILES